MDIVSALYFAARYGHGELDELLQKHKSGIKRYNCADSLLHCSLLHGNIEGAKLLIQHGAKVNIESSIHTAVICQIPEYLNFLLNNYKHEVINSASDRSDNLNKLLVFAVKAGNLEIIKGLLDAGADINYENLSGNILLMESRNLDVTRFLISRGADVNKVMHDGNTPLLKILVNSCKISSFNSSFNNIFSCIGFIKLFLENGASVNDGQLEGTTPVMLAASTKGSVPILQILLNHGADLSVQDKKGDTALMHAIYSKCSENVLFLLRFAKEKDIGLNVQNNKGMTAVMCAAFSSTPKVLKELLDYNVDVNIKDHRGNTALIHAISHHVVPRSENLINLAIAGSDVNCQNNDGFSPLMLATYIFWKEGILTLLDLGADVNAVSKTDSTLTALSFLGDDFDELNYKSNFRTCLLALLRRGASSSYANHNLLHINIFKCDHDVILELIQSGLGPADTSVFIETIGDIRISPLCAALLAGNVSLVQYFVGKLFLTNSDITPLSNNKKLSEILGKKLNQDCLIFLNKMSLQPMSLFQHAFVAVSSAVGTSPGRENRVTSLPLPQLVKDKLLFKTKDVKLNISRAHTDFFRFFSCTGFSHSI